MSSYLLFTFIFSHIMIYVYIINVITKIFAALCKSSLYINILHKVLKKTHKTYLGRQVHCSFFTAGPQHLFDSGCNSAYSSLMIPSNILLYIIVLASMAKCVYCPRKLKSNQLMSSSNNYYFYYSLCRLWSNVKLLIDKDNIVNSRV